jgi:hypothetical protein
LLEKGTIRKVWTGLLLPALPSPKMGQTFENLNKKGGKVKGFQKIFLKNF